jgi:hypothetical protein
MTNSEELLLQAKRPQSEIDQLMKTIGDSKEQMRQSSVFDFLKTYLYYVGITGLFAIIFSFILKRKPPVFGEDNFIQS